jgi:hypothetical protein
LTARPARRSVALTAIAVPGALLAWTAGKARAHPLQTAGSAAAGAAAIAGAVVLGPKLLPAHPVAARHIQVPSAPSASPRVEVISDLSIGGRPVSTAKAGQSLRSMIGEVADASDISVVAAVTHNGFWIGTAQARIWVQLVGPLRPLHIHAGDRVRFDGTVAGNSPAYPASVGVTGSGDAELLSRQGAHLTVNTTKISVQP